MMPGPNNNENDNDNVITESIPGRRNKMKGGLCLKVLRSCVALFEAGVKLAAMRTSEKEGMWCDVKRRYWGKFTALFWCGVLVELGLAGCRCSCKWLVRVEMDAMLWRI